MLKKAVIVYLLLLAYTCVLVHNLIPHHHHSFTTDKHHHHQDENHEEEHHEHDGDDHKKETSHHLFVYHQHSSPDSQIEHIVSLSENTILKYKLLTLPLNFFYFHFKPPKIPDDPLPEAYSSQLTYSYHTSSCSLRAPPSILF